MPVQLPSIGQSGNVPFQRQLLNTCRIFSVNSVHRIHTTSAGTLSGPGLFPSLRFEHAPSSSKTVNGMTVEQHTGSKAVTGNVS